MTLAHVPMIGAPTDASVAAAPGGSYLELAPRSSALSTTLVPSIAPPQTCLQDGIRKLKNIWMVPFAIPTYPALVNHIIYRKLWWSHI
jgi:hypothetical protein